ncbi:hypothetical protein JTB14_018059 [Gonioctena quinquepunctata]|nr:hypothetical protein JTB14_018059 [Gonioctena quinquepunctata]
MFVYILPNLRIERGLKEEFQKGCLGVKRTDKSFNRIPIDLILEQTINADAARSITTMTNSISARQRWAIISHIFDEAGLKKNDDVVPELKKSAMKKNQESLYNFMTSIDEYMNPFDPTLDIDKLFNVTNGEVATRNIEDFLLNVEKNGNFACETFLSECREDLKRYELPIKKKHTFAKAIKKQNCRCG